MTQRRRNLATFALLIPIPGIASANVGVPLLAFAWPVHWLALLPIVALEAALVARAIGLPYRELVWPVAKANLWSSLVGVPVAWLAMLALQFLVVYGVFVLSPETLQTSTIPLPLFPFTVAWLVDVSTWNVYAAFVVLAIPMCIASIVVERWWLSISLPFSDRAAMRSGVRTANVVSYVLMTAAALAYPLLA